MAVDTQIGLGCQFWIQTTTTSSAQTQVKGLQSSDGPSPSGSEVECSSLDSTSNFEEYQGGLINPGTVVLSFAYDAKDAGQILMAAALASREVRTMKVVMPSTAQADETFQGIVNGGGRSIAKGSMILRPFTVRVTGEPGWPTTT